MVAKVVVKQIALDYVIVHVKVDVRKFVTLAV